MDTLMGGGNSPESLMIYAEAIQELWPDMSVQDFGEAMKYGLKNVDVSYKVNVATIAKFIRAWQNKPPMTKTEAEAEMHDIRVKNGRDPVFGAVYDEECSRALLVYRGVVKA